MGKRTNSTDIHPRDRGCYIYRICLNLKQIHRFSGHTFMKTSFHILFLVFCLQVMGLSDLGVCALPFETSTEKVLQIEDTRTRIGFFSVKLSVGELREFEGNLVGSYTIIVPFFKSKNDNGEILLDIEGTSLEEIIRKGGRFTGIATSNKEGEEDKSNTVVCNISPLEDSIIHLKITTEDRTLKFKSRYSVL